MKRYLPAILTLYIAFVFIQSLFFKFMNAPETQHIFNTIDAWAADSFGKSGLFVPPGPFNGYVIGVVELVASILLLVGLFAKRPKLHALGALIAFGVICGAIFFHLGTPLGVNVQGDGGLLFGMAIGVVIATMILLAQYWRQRA